MADAPLPANELAIICAHRACCGTEHDPAQGKLHGYCIVCGVPWPCETAAFDLRPAKIVDVVFDGPPGPTAGRFIEVEDSAGKSIQIGTWVERADGYWALRVAVFP